MLLLLVLWLCGVGVAQNVLPGKIIKGADLFITQTALTDAPLRYAEFIQQGLDYVATHNSYSYDSGRAKCALFRAIVSCTPDNGNRRFTMKDVVVTIISGSSLGVGGLYIT